MAKKLKAKKPAGTRELGVPKTPRVRERAAAVAPEGPRGLSLTNPAYNTAEGFQKLRQISQLRSLPTPAQLNEVVQVARRTVGLEDVWDELELVKKDYQRVFNLYREWIQDPQRPYDLTPFAYRRLMDNWYDFERMVLQRAAGVYTTELRAADRVALDIFRRFYGSNQFAPANRSYSDNARPVTFIGPTGPDAYYTWPPNTRRPLGIVNLPDGSANNVWSWLALAHEVGHDIYASIFHLGEELEAALQSALRDAGAAGQFALADVNYDDERYAMKLTGADFASLLWKRWANEAQADIVGLLNCGSAAAVTLQPIIGFDTEQTMEPDLMSYDSQTQRYGLAPEAHPTPYLRNIFNIAALRALGFNQQADELQTRFESLRPAATQVEFKLEFGGALVTSQPIAELEKTVAVAVPVFLARQFAALNNHSYRQIIDFSAQDQMIVDGIVDKLLGGDPLFDADARPRHALSATVLALEKDAAKAETIHETFVQFLSPVGGQ